MGNTLDSSGVQLSGSSSGDDVNVTNGAGGSAVNIQDGGNSLTVDGTVAVSNFPSALDVNVTNLVLTVDGTINVGNFPATQDVNVTNASLAVTGPLTDAQLRAAPVPISAASLPLPSGAATSSLQTTGNASLSSIDGKLPSGLAVTSTRLLVDGSGVTQPISGSVAVSNFPATQPVSGTVAVSNLPATQAISAVTLPLPSGASTEATLASLNGKVTTVNTGAVVVASSALPSGAATGAKQDTGNSSLSSIDAKTPTLLSDTVPSTAFGVIGTALGAFDALPIQYEDLGADGFGNSQAALWVYDKAGARSSSVTSFSMAFGGFDEPITNTSGGSVVMIDVSGTWTGSLSIQSALAVNTPTIPVRQAGTGTLVTSITANGLYILEGDVQTTAQIINSLASGTADIYTFAPAWTQTGFYSHQAGTWNILNISGTISLPTGASTSSLQTTGNTSLASLDTKTPSLGQAAMAASRPVVIASNQTAVPVSGTVTANLAAGTNNIGDVDVLTLPSLIAGAAIIGKVGIDQTTPGTTNKVSIGTDGTVALNAAIPTGGNTIGAVTNTNLDVALSTRLKPADTLAGVTAVGSITNALPAGTNAIGKLAANSGVDIGDVDVTSLPALTAGTNRIGAVRLVDSADADLTSAKGSQTSRAVGTQDLKDSGRTALSFYAVAAASGSTGVETAITLTKSAGTGAVSTAVSFVVTSGKRFRITHISVATRGNSTATIQTTTFNLRINTGGGVTTGSTPIIFSARSATPATASAWDRYSIPIPDGFEILGDGTLQFGITAAATFTTNAPTWDVNIIGYEY